MKIELGKSSHGDHVTIDISTLITTRMLVTASSGGGKSETLRRILEEAVDHVQCIVIDPEGEFSTLREKKPFVLVGEGGETPADIRTASLVATRLLELNASAVCDIYELKVHERHEWVKRFLDTLVHAPKSLWHPVLVVVDEAHTYCPEHGYGESVASQAVIDLCNLGRKRGFCAILATQRLSKLSKNAAEPLQNFLVGRTMYDDQKRAASIFKVDPGKPTREFSLELERLKAGEFICRGRALSGDMLRVQVTRGITRPPATGTAMAGVVTPTPAAIKALLPKLADLPHEAEKKAKTESDLRLELAEAKRTIANLEREAKNKNVPDPAVVKSLQNRIKELEAYTQDMAKTVDKARVGYEKIGRILSEVLPPPIIQIKSDFDLSKMDIGGPEKIRYAPAPIRQPITYTPMRKELESTNGNLRAGARRMLAALCQWSPAGRTEAQLAAQVQMKRTGGTWAAYKSDLRNGNYIEIRGDGLWYSTDYGREYLGENIPETPTTTQEVVQLWGEKLRKGAREMLDVLVNHRGHPVAKDDLGSAVGMEPSGGTFAAYLSDLKQAGLIIVDRDGVRANAETLLL